MKHTITNERKAYLLAKKSLTWFLAHILKSDLSYNSLVQDLTSLHYSQFSWNDGQFLCGQERTN